MWRLAAHIGDTGVTEVGIVRDSRRARCLHVVANL
jgi:hypothetical protein